MIETKRRKDAFHAAPANNMNRSRNLIKKLRKLFLFGCNKVKENDILRAYDTLQDIEQRNHKVIENESSSSSNHKNSSLNAMMMSPFTTINEYYEDTSFSSSNDDEPYIYREIQSNTNIIEEKMGMISIDSSSRLSRLNEYEEVYFSNVYVHNEKEEENEEDENCETRRLDLSFQKNCNEKKKDISDDEESEDGWSDTETLHDEDDSWYVDIDLPALLRSNIQKSISTQNDDHFNSENLVDNIEEWFQKLDQKNIPIGSNRNVMGELETKYKARLKKQISLTKNKMIQATSYRDIMFHVDDDGTDVSYSSVDPPLTPCIHTFKEKEKHKIKSKWFNEINNLSASSLSTIQTNNVKPMSSYKIKSTTTSALKQEILMNSLLENLNISSHTSATIFDDETNKSFYSLIKVKQRMILTNNNSGAATTTMNNDNNSFNHIQSELDLLRNDSLDEERNTQKTQQQQQQYNIEHDTDDDQLEKIIVGGIAYSAKDIERAWIEVEYSQHLQDDVYNQTQDLCNKGSRFNCCESTPIRVKATRQTCTSLRKQNNNGDVEIYKLCQNQISNKYNDNGIHHHDTKCKINGRLEI